MAKKQITSRSSYDEIKTANDQLRAAEVEYKEVVESWPKASTLGLGAPGPGDYYINPTNNSPMTLSNWDTVKANIAAKYDYVDYGMPPTTTSSNEINIAPTQFFVNGLGNNTQTSFDSTKSQTIASDDAYRAPTTVTPAVNQPGNNPNAAKTNQTTNIESTNNQTAIQNPNVTSDTQTSTNTTQKELSESEKSVATQEQVKAQNTGTGVVDTNPNTSSTTANSGRLDNTNKTIGTVGQNDDAAKPSKGNIGQQPTAGSADSAFNGISTTPDPGRTGTGGTTIGTNQSITVAPQAAGTPNNPQVEVRSNVLHNYVNWTYKIGLYMLSTDVYNKLIASGDITAEAKEHPILVSGGFPRKSSSQIPQGDYYIDELRFTSIIGNQSAAAATHNIDLEMTIVEPYGAQLIGDLSILGDQLNKDMTLAEIPYLLEIDFTGYKDDGTPVESILKDGKKYIPVRLIQMDMKLESAGARYTFQMVPYSLFALSPRYAVVPKVATVMGRTFSEVIGEGPNGLIGQLNKASQELVTKDGHQRYADKYQVKIYSFSKDGTQNQDLENSPVAFPTAAGQATIPKNRPFNNVDRPPGDTQTQSYTFEPNSLIISAIKTLVYASEYFPQKMTPNAPNSQTDSPAELIKIIPHIEINTNEWDDLRNEYSKTITYHVFNNLLWGENFEYGGIAPIKQWGYSKIYNYLFTGKNDDIINCDIAFNLVYYTKITPDRKETGITRNDINTNYELTKGKITPNRIANPTFKSTTTEKNAPSDNFRYVNATLAANYADLKMNNSYGDMIQVDLEIIGDPEWIPQDASVRGGPFKIGDYTTKLDSHGSISIDVAGVYVKLQFKTPRDYNDAKGTMDITKDQSLVGGVYRVIQVQNIFAGGKFISILNMNKIPNQEDNEKPSTAGYGGGINANPGQFGGPR
jgi:hypothetical protein